VNRSTLLASGTASTKTRADDDPGERGPVVVELETLGPVRLRVDLAVFDDGADDLHGREEAVEEDVADRLRGHDAEIRLDEQVDRPEGRERQAERQDDRTHRVDGADVARQLPQP
jgi:hypothetical protein